jgi:phosphoadenosine phosphosulfate reductase
MIHQLDFNGNDKVDKAIMRLQAYEPKEGYYLCFSGGKDSCVIKALADMAGVKYDAHYNVTGIDPPELVQFIKTEHADVVFEKPYDKDGNRITMWTLIPQKRMPPTRLARYCCQELKEQGGTGRFVVTGVRWAESARRKNTRNILELHEKNGVRVYSSDNVEDAPTFKFCHQYHKRVLNPIVDWTDAEVWEFVKEYKIPYCKLYDEGFKRLGCIGCPMGTGKGQKAQFERYPKFENLYLMAFQKLIDTRKELGLEVPKKWETPEKLMQWWMQDEAEIPDTMITQELL